MKKTLAVLAVLALSVSLVQATPITVPNYSFEVLDPEGDIFNVEGWEFASTGGGFALYTNNGRTVPTVGDYFLDIQVGADAVCTMTSAAPLAAAVAGDTYTLTAQTGNAQWVGTGPEQGDGPNDPLTQVAILLDGIAVATSPVYDTSLGADGVFVDQSVSYTALAGDAGKNITVQLIGMGRFETLSTQADFDNVRLEVVPEPATLTLLGLGAVVLRLRRKR